MQQHNYLSQLGIEDLWMSGTSLTARDISTLIATHPLRALYAKESAFDDTAAAALSHNPSLCTLDVSGTALTDRGFAVLPSKHVVTLYIEHTGVTHNGLHRIASFESLQELGLDGTQLDLLVGRALEQAPQIRVVNLWGNSVGDHHMQMLTRVHQLTNIFLYDTAVTTKSYELFEEANPLCEIAEQ